MSIRTLASVILVSLALAAPAAADTVVPGGTVINQTWTTAGSPYTLQGDITIPTGAFLTIQAGVIVQAPANADSQSAGNQNNRTEILVDGTLTVAGTSGNPVTFQSSSTGSGTWYGIVVNAGAAAVDIDGAVVRDAIYGVTSSAPTNVLDIDNSMLTESSSYGLFVRAGAPDCSALELVNNSQAGAYVDTSGSLTLTNAVVRGNGSYGVLFTPSSARTLTIASSTFYANGSYGIYVSASVPSTVAITSSIITHHSTYGIYRADSSSVTTTYSNVWSNTTANFAGGISGGTGVIAANPIYVSAPGNLRLTSNSPSRFTGAATTDMGALPYISDATPGLYGTLWNDRTLTAAGGPTYAAAGDLTIAPGVTLTVEPGVIVQFSGNSDVMGASVTNRGELLVNGRLVADGTPAAPIVFASSSTGSGTWQGIDLAPAVTGVVMDNVTVQDAVYGVTYRATGAGNVIGNSTISESSSYGLFVRAGAPAFDAMQLVNNSQAGAYVDTSGSLTLTNTIVRGNGSYGVLFTPSSARTLAITNSTFYANGSYGVYVSASVPSTVTIASSIITHHSTYGIYRADSSSVTTTYSNVWSNTTANFAGGISGGTGVIAANPIYVAASSNLRLTENSPSRFGGAASIDMGALPYASDPTPGLYGTLWSNRTLTAAGGPPYAAAGDLTIAPGVTLTVEPGVAIQFSGNSDVMGAGVTNRGELLVNGTLIADGTTAAPILFSSTSTGSGTWQGLDIAPAVTGLVMDNVTVQDAVYGITYRATGTNNIGHSTITEASSYGLFVRAGAPALDGMLLVNNSQAGAYVDTSGSLTLTNSVLRGNGSYGVLFTPSSARTLTLTNSTVYANGSYGIYVSASVPSTVNITNAIVTHHSTYGIYRADSSSVTTTYSDVWSNTTANFAGGISAGTGCISQNPNYVSAPNDLRLLSSSVTIDAGTTGPLVDLLGVVRPQNGNGIGGSEWDMGAYEFVLTAMCGNGAVEPGETCDSGAANGMYGACNGTCTALGARCGDSVMNGPEQCDDGNASNTDACLNTCRNATCGDGFLRPGSEQCDDGNLINTDACVGACVNASCGDGYVRAGTEECDDGNMNNADACSNVCMASTCGDGIVQAGEECDDDNLVDTDSCRNSCLAARCGDGVIRTGVEQCDDGNTVATDACTGSCTTAVCGDGVVYAGMEECDDANASNTDACVMDCDAARCGDGYVRAGTEGCDDGNTVDTDACTNSCVSSTCGDGVVQAGVETCDDNNDVDTDGCRNNCSLAMCGDNVVQLGVEDCDDGNTSAGDGCSPTCEAEANPDGGTGPDAGNPGDGDGGGCCSASSAARDTSLLAGFAVLMAMNLRRRRRRSDMIG